MDSEDIALFLYNTYGNDADWKNHRGEPMPRWGELPHETRRHWLAVAAAAASVRRRL